MVSGFTQSLFLMRLLASALSQPRYENKARDELYGPLDPNDGIYLPKVFDIVGGGRSD
jgi:hypothetical protein